MKLRRFLKGCGPIIPCLAVGICAAQALGNYQAPDEDAYKASIVQAAELPDGDKEDPAEEDSSDQTTEVSDSTASSEDVSISGDDVDLASCADGTYEGSGRGFQDGKTTVRVTIKDHKITAIEVVSNQDTASYFNKAKSLINTIISTQSTDVDAVSGATYSSRGIIEAVKNALKRAAGQSVSDDFSGNSGSTAAAAAAGAGSASYSIAPTPQNLKDGIYTGSGQGFGGTTTVQVVVSGGVITSVKVLSHNDTQEYFSRAEVLCDRIVANNGVNGLDAVSGATYSSRGILQAVSNALSKAGVSGSSNNSTGTGGSSNSVINDNNGSQNNTNDGNNQDNSGGATNYEDGKYPYLDGVYTGVGEGNGGEIRVAVFIQNNTIYSVILLSAADEDEPFLTNAKAVLPKIVTEQSAEVDTISGATYSSRGILDAVKDALNTAKKLTDEQSSGTDDTGNTDSGDTDSGNMDSGNTDSGQDGSGDKDPGPYIDGTYAASAMVDPGDDGDFDPYTLSLNVRIENGYITSIDDVTGSGDGYVRSDERYINRALNGTTTSTGVAEQIFTKNGTEGVDAVSGATWSSNAMIRMVEEVLKQASK
jgi:uncharacterized protein with FMN-binding domain